MGRLLQDLDYFMEWGGRSWQSLMSYAFEHFLGTDLRGQQVLEIGSRYGKMTCLFALLGAKVIGIDTEGKSLLIAQQEAAKWKAEDAVLFIKAGGDLSIIKDNSFDVVFSKSVLVMVPDLAGFLEEVKQKLKPGGKIVFLENAKGPRWLHLLRAVRHMRKWDYAQARYFTSQEVKMVSQVFDEFVMRSWMFPPVILMMGCKPKVSNPL
ncbi:MAG TPA: class I SAM-dependent methyltransferase [Nitrospira sp.]|nr:class I SAM-dependent methyltransferase [Nitrospira sp.]